MKIHRQLLVLLTGVGAFFALHGPVSAQTAFTVLGQNFYPESMSADSTKVVGNGPDTLEGGAAIGTELLWTHAGGFTNLGMPSQAYLGTAGVISRDGTTFAGSSGHDAYVGVIGSGSAQMITTPSGVEGLYVSGISANGSVVGGNAYHGPYDTNPAFAVYSYGGGSATPLTNLAGGNLYAAVHGVTPSGSLVGNSVNAGGSSEATVWTGGVPVGYGQLYSDAATSFNAGVGGTYVGVTGTADGSANIGLAYLPGTGLKALQPVAGGMGAEAQVISDDGLLFGGYSNGGTLHSSTATFWDTAGTAYKLSDLLAASSLGYSPFSEIDDIVAINGHNGVYDVLGYGRSGGYEYGFLVTGLSVPVISAIPEPGTYAAIAGGIVLGVAGLGRRRRRQRESNG